MGERRKRLERLTRSTKILKTIRQDLLLSPQESQWLDAIQTRNEQFIAQELIACREAEVLEKQKLRAIEKARAEAIKVQRTEVHSKSGLSDYVKRADGSFGSGRS